MSHFELLYFPVTGRVDATRILLVVSGANHTDKRIAREEWPGMKWSMPFAHLPLLTETKPDGTKFVLAETNAINRYLAKKFGYFGTTDEETALIDQIYEAWIEYAVKYFTLVSNLNTPESKAKAPEQIAALLKDVVKTHEPILAKNPNGWYVGDKMTLADIFAFSRMQGCYESYRTVFEETFNEVNSPNLYGLWKKVRQNERVMAYLEANKRP